MANRIEPPAPLPSGRQEHDLSLNAYVFMRTMAGKDTTPAQAQRLGQADATVKQTRRVLRYGRGNVSTDLAATNNEAYARKDQADGRAKARMMVAMLKSKGNLPANTVSVNGAAFSRLAEAGNCGGHAAVAASLHEAPDVVTVRHSKQDHNWAEIYPKGDKRVVMDPWLEGPAILAEDGAYAKHIANTRVLHRWNEDDRQDVAAKMREHKGETAKIAEAAKQTPVVTGKIYDPESVLDPAFAAQAQAALTAPAGTGLNADLRHAIAAAGASRLLGASAQVATKQADAVVAEAHRLISEALPSPNMPTETGI